MLNNLFLIGCNVGYYKDTISNSSCIKCPEFPLLLKVPVLLEAVVCVVLAVGMLNFKDATVSNV